MWKIQNLDEKTLVITGASSGIGAALALECAKQGARLVLSARRLDKIQSVADECRQLGAGDVWASQLDVRDRNAVLAWWDGVPSGYKKDIVLVNNAGLARDLSKFQDNKAADWAEMLDTNVQGLLHVTELVLPSMLAENSGHIVNIGSLAGLAAYPKGAVYCASKAAVRILSDGIRQDLVDTAIRVSCIQPGMVETEFSLVRFKGDVQKAAQVYQGIQALSAEDIAQSILFMILAPSHVQICELTLTPTKQASGGVVHRQ